MNLQDVKNCVFLQFLNFFLTFATPPPLPALGCFWLYKKLQASRSECTVQLDLRQRRVLLPFIPSVMQGMGRYLRIYWQCCVYCVKQHFIWTAFTCFTVVEIKLDSVALSRSCNTESLRLLTRTCCCFRVHTFVGQLS